MALEQDKLDAGLTPEERSLFNAARKRYWQREWDSGRFRNLPD